MLKHSVAWRLGYTAYVDGAESWDNPYSSDEPENSEDWREGWDEAEEDYAAEAESQERDRFLDDPRRW